MAYRANSALSVLIFSVMVSATHPTQAGGGGGGFFGATEFTQILNNAELIAIGGQNAQQIAHQVTQISNQVQQIANQIQIYQNMLQNTLKLPEQIWGQAEQDLLALQSIVQQGQGIAFSMGNLDDVIKERFASYSQFKDALPTSSDFSLSYQSWSDTNRDTIASSLKAANLTARQFQSEEATLAQLRNQSASAIGQMQALQIGHQIASQQINQMQKLRGLVSQHMTSMGTWYQSQQAQADLAQARREQFFRTKPPTTSGGQLMQPRF